ncbi:phosphotransferase [Bacillus coahuilensis m2-6]|uniref:phosphotransferase family protein n=1 Tax=Bacillus coahuilensis TaxID=408580 RepID=UPI0007504A8B|nr:phosphotransferase family protein [Bacillus coahuilensis]KUP06721.1 phosphotransferase [Bacillus coahuilensis m2-6]
MEHLFDKEWTITPAGGATGEAYFAQREEQKLFLKRNSSPFLAVLSAEGIVPKLIWTKRLENGDVITAQSWMSGRELSARDMNDISVAKLLHKIHSTKPLLTMLERLGVKPFQPEEMLIQVETGLDTDLTRRLVVEQSIQFLQETIGDIYTANYVVCHGDLNHNNWLLSDDGDLYLIDWDSSMIGDPAIDLGLILYWYIPREDWGMWLSQYGVELSNSLKIRMKWYVICQTLLSVQWHYSKDRVAEMNQLLLRLEGFITL